MVLLENAAVHYHKEAGFARLLSSFFVDDFFLHPNGGYAQLDRLVNNFVNEFRSTEDVDDVDLLRNIAQRWIGFLTQHFSNARIDRDDLIAMALHVRGNAMARTQWIIGKSNHRDGASAAQQVMDRIRLGVSSHARIVTRRGITPCSRVRSFA